MRAIAALAAAAILFTAQAAIACDIPPPQRDANGNIIPPPPPDPVYWNQRMDAAVTAATISFVGTVVAYRTVSGALIQGRPRYPDEDPVISWVFRIEHAIEGIEPGAMFFEEPYQESSCGAYFAFGARFLYANEGWDSTLLEEPATPEQVARWRSLAEAPPSPDPIRHPVENAEDCFTPERFIEDVLAPPSPLEVPVRAYVARIAAFRLNDSLLTDDFLPCADRASAACAAFKQRIVSIVVDIETVITGDPDAIGHREFSFWGWENAGCSLPQPGQLFLLGAAPWDLAVAAEPRVLLAEAPTERQLEWWRAAARVLVPFEMTNGAVETRLRLEFNPSDIPVYQIGPTLRISNDGAPIVLTGIMLNRNARCETLLYPALLQNNPRGRRAYMALDLDTADFYTRGERTTDYEPAIGAPETVTIETGGTVDIVVQDLYGPMSTCARPMAEILLRTSHGDFLVTALQ